MSYYFWIEPAPPVLPPPPPLCRLLLRLPYPHTTGGMRALRWRGRTKFEIFSRTKGDPYIDMRGWLVFLVDDVCKPRIRSVQDPCVYVVWGLVFVVHTPGADKAVDCTSFDSRLPS